MVDQHHSPITNPHKIFTPKTVLGIVAIAITLICALVGTIYSSMVERVEGNSSQAVINKENIRTNKENIRNLATVVPLKMEAMNEAIRNIKINQTENQKINGKHFEELLSYFISYSKDGKFIGHSQ